MTGKLVKSSTEAEITAYLTHFILHCSRVDGGGGEGGREEALESILILLGMHRWPHRIRDSVNIFRDTSFPINRYMDWRGRVPDFEDKL